jgi:hypothetical protein
VNHLFDRFDEIVLGDTEFISRPGELYTPVCLAYQELKSKRSGAVFSDELGPEPPHAHGSNVLFVGFTAAEVEFYWSVYGIFDMAFLDLRVEGIHQTNFAWRRDDPRRQKLPRSLISFLRANDIHDGDEAIKETMRERIMQGPPYDLRERGEILKYCMGDVLLLEKLMQVLLPRIPNFDQALMRGEYVKLTGEMFAIGMPADPWSSGMLRRPEVREAVRLRAVSDESLTHGLYRGRVLDQARLREFITRHKVKGWRETRTGKLGTAGKDLERLRTKRPGEFDQLPDANKIVTQLHEMQLVAGSDGRYRTPIWAFSTITSRMAPNGAAFPFTVPSWCRFTISPAEGSALCYLDFSGMEFGVAGGLARCASMIEDYHQEPYLVLPILAGLLPADATKRTHGKIRDAYKPTILAIQYGGGAGLLVDRLKLSKSQARGVVDLHKERYREYWDWSDRRLDRAFDDGELVARDGWRCGINSRSPVFTARNWLIQANAQAIFRYASLMMGRLGLRICAPIHDAVLLECRNDRVRHDVALAIECLQRASRRFLHGLTLRVDAKYILPGERFTDPRGEKPWDFVDETLRELEEGMRYAAGRP